MRCVVSTCKVARSEEVKRFFVIPSIVKNGGNEITHLTDKRRRLWLLRLNLTEKQVNRNSRICQQHFISGKPADYWKTSDPDWVPTKNMPDNKSHTSYKRHMRQIKFNEKRELALAQSATNEEPNPELANISEQNCEVSPKEEGIINHQYEHNNSQNIHQFCQCSGQLERCEIQITKVQSITEVVTGDTIADSSIAENHMFERHNLSNEIAELRKQRSQAVLLSEALKKKLDELEGENTSQRAKFSRQDEQQKQRITELETELKRLRQDAARQSDEHKNDIMEFEQQIGSLQKDMFECYERIERSFYERCRQSDDYMRFYTNLDVKMFDALYSAMEPEVKENKNCALPEAEQMFLCLVKITRNFTVEDLAFRFRISRSTVSRYFYKWITLIYLRLNKMFIVWPERDIVKLSMPMCFRDRFPNLVAIIDCFEIKCEVPHNPLDQVSTILATRRLTRRRKSSDIFIIKSSGFMKMIQSGDLVMADRGFTAESLFGLLGATLVTPAFMQRRAQLSQRETEDNRRISNVRIHVERVIGALRMRFKLLRGPLYVSLFDSVAENDEAFLDRVVAVCCIINNLLPSVVPFE